MCLQQLSVSGALYRLTASLAESAFSSLTPSNRRFFEVHLDVIRTSFCAAFHGIHSRAFIGPDDNHGSILCLVHFRLREIATAHRGWRPLPRYFNLSTPSSSSPNRSWSGRRVLKWSASSVNNGHRICVSAHGRSCFAVCRPG